MKSRSKSVTKAIKILHKLRKLDKYPSWLHYHKHHLGYQREELLRSEIDIRRKQLLIELSNLVDNILDLDVSNKLRSK